MKQEKLKFVNKYGKHKFFTGIDKQEILRGSEKNI